MARRVVYTVMVGGYEPLQPAPPTRGDVTCVCLTDDTSIDPCGWELRHLPRALPADPVRSARRAKILAAAHVPEADESLYIDNTVRLRRPADDLFDELLPAGVAAAFVRHSFRGPLSDEFDAVAAAHRDAGWVCDEQLAAYRSTVPEALAAQTLWSGIVLRRHGDAALDVTMATWWRHVCRYSRRDQLSLPVALQLAPVAHVVHDLDNQSSPYHEWPIADAMASRVEATFYDRPERDLAARDAEIDRLTRAAAESAEALARAVAARDEAVAAAGAAAERADAEAARAASAEAEAAASDARAVAASARVTELLASRSWKASAPLRLVTSATRRVRARH